MLVALRVIVGLNSKEIVFANTWSSDILCKVSQDVIQVGSACRLM